MSFKRLDPEDVTISAESIVAPAWSGQLTSLSTGNFVTQSSQASRDFYYNILQANPAIDASATTQFAISYGNLYGSGSQPITAAVSGASPSSITYGQYRTLVTGDENTNFTFGTTVPNSIFVVSVSRSRYKEKLLPGSFNITLRSGSNVLHLTDNSKGNTVVSFLDSGRVYDIVSGSNGMPYTGLTTTGFTLASGSYGKFLPDIGTAIFNGRALTGSVAGGGLAMPINEKANIANNTNLDTFYEAIKQGSSFRLQSEETISSNYVFIRVRNSEYNYSTNPSLISGSGDLRFNVMINNPQSYITTVGMYNDNNDLLAVAKLSKPLIKDFTKETLIRIKLDY